MCGGFTCTKHSLAALNLLYILVSFLLIGITVYGRASSIAYNVSIISGIIVCGAFLFFLAILGLIGAVKHHQVLLFFYMVILFVLFVVQFSIACACLAISDEQQLELAKTGWNKASSLHRLEAQKFFHCCGFMNQTLDDRDYQGCTRVVECCSEVSDCQCPTCAPRIKLAIANVLQVYGGIGLFFSLTEFLGVWLTVRYRNLKDPRADRSAFL